MSSGDTTVAPRHIPSVSELLAALAAAEAGRFARPAAAPAAPAARTAGTPGVTGRARHHRARPVIAAPPASGGTGVWLLGTHGGSGARCLATVLAGTRPAGTRWPTVESNREPVVLVCRASHRGLSSAQDYARAHRDEGLTEHLRLLGVIISADAPGRTPPPLRRLERLLSGALPILGHAPWEPSWRIGPPGNTTEPPPWVAKLSGTLNAASAVA